jgi:thiol-disulfide isomerase/thioredoxin
MNKTKPTLSLTILVCLIMACSNNNKQTEKIIENNQITVIFENTPQEWQSGETGCMVLSKIEYIDDNFIQHQFVPDTTKKFDTLIVSTKRKIVEFRHNYKTLDKLSYLFQKGDSAIIRYQNTTPVATVINRETKLYDLNYDLFKREKLTTDGYPAYVKFKQPMSFADYSNGFIGADEKVVNLAKEKFIIEMKQEKELLDSLEQFNLISKNISQYYYTQTLYQQKRIQLQNIVGPHSIKPLYQKLAPEDFNLQLGFDKELGWLHNINILDSQNDSLLYFGYYSDITNWIYYNYLSRKVGRIKSTNYVNNIATVGSNLADYLSLADTIYESNLLSSHSKNILLLKNIQQIIENNSIDEAKKAFKKFENEVKDSVLIKYVQDKYLLGSDTINETNDLQLISTNSERISYNELIKKYAGKVIYIDFWGSYCQPCIKQFKYSSNLKELYREKNLTQVYISAEPDKERWREACKKYNLEHESYFVVNRFTSKQLENMNIKYIPHYLLYGKSGKLVNEFAPRPSEKGLITLLDKYLTEDE